MQIRFGLVSAYTKGFDEEKFVADMTDMHSQDMHVISAEPDADGFTLFFSDCNYVAPLLKAMRAVICGSGWEGFAQEWWGTFNVPSVRIIGDIFFDDEHENLFATWQVEVDNLETAFAELAVAALTNPEPQLTLDFDVAP